MKIKNIFLDKLISEITNKNMIRMFGKKNINKNIDMDLQTLKIFNLSKEEINFSFTFFNFHKKELAINVLISLYIDNEWQLYQPIENLRTLNGEETIKIVDLYKQNFLTIIEDIKNSKNIHKYLADKNFEIVR